MKAIRTAVKTVEASKLDKTIDDASRLLKDSEGKVQDARTRETLSKAIKARDAVAIAKAVKAVNDSKAAKAKADRGSQGEGRAGGREAESRRGVRRRTTAVPERQRQTAGTGQGRAQRAGERPNAVHDAEAAAALDAIRPIVERPVGKRRRRNAGHRSRTVRRKERMNVQNQPPFAPGTIPRPALTQLVLRSRPVRPPTAYGWWRRMGERVHHNPHEREGPVRGRDAACRSAPTPSPSRVVRCAMCRTQASSAPRAARRLERGTVRPDRPHGRRRHHAVAEDAARSCARARSGRLRRARALWKLPAHPRTRPRRLSRETYPRAYARMLADLKRLAERHEKT